MFVSTLWKPITFTVTIRMLAVVHISESQKNAEEPRSDIPFALEILLSLLKESGLFFGSSPGSSPTDNRIGWCSSEQFVLLHISVLSTILLNLVLLGALHVF